MTMVGMPARLASSIGRTRARSSSGAITMPETFWLTKPSTTCTCCSRSSSRSGPFQVMVTGVPAALSSRSALTAPAWIDFQNSCVVPFGITAIDSAFPPLPALPEQATTVIVTAAASPAAASH